MAKAILFALENFQKMNGEVYNVGDDRLNYSKEAICLLIKKKVDYYLHFAEVGHDLDQRDYIVSYQKINKIGYKTRISMEAGIDELIEACKAIDNPFLFSNV
jgi:nucleoside-diphosphate-sugar epimerase